MVAARARRPIAGSQAVAGFAAVLGLLVLTTVGVASCSRVASDVVGARDGPEFDRLEAAFDENREAFDMAAQRTLDVAAANSEMERITWLVLVRCMAGPDDAMSCVDTDDVDRDLYQALPNVSAVVFQRKDADRVFFRVNVEDPPTYHLMYAPDEPDPSAYAGAAGFRSLRQLDDSWTLLGPISDQAAYDAQFPGSE